jgi:hypothetical protein
MRHDDDNLLAVVDAHETLVRVEALVSFPRRRLGSRSASIEVWSSCPSTPSWTRLGRAPEASDRSC